MFNPFSKFEQKFIPVFREVKKRFLVSQTFKRDNDLFKNENIKYLLLTHYEDKGLAKIHFNALSADKFAAIIDLEKDEHRNKLISMTMPGSGYVIYSSLTIHPRELKKIADKLFAEKVQQYIRLNTNWRIGRDQTVTPKLEITFGELYVVIKYGSQTIRIRLEELENI